MNDRRADLHPPPAGGVRQNTDKKNRDGWQLVGIKAGHCPVRSTPLRAVKDVEELGPESQLHRFVNREILEPGKIRV